jgi:hypothetical protein
VFIKGIQGIGGSAMKDNGVLLKVTLLLDEKWASHHTKDEIIESVRTRLDTSLGFRGRTVKLKVVDKQPSAPTK